jgi:hypothetical protein
VAYTITLTDGVVLTTIADNTVDTTTSMTLIGHNFSGYGGYIAEDFVHLLENFANTAPPSAPLVGQLFYNKTTNALQMWTGTSWNNVGIPADGTLSNTNLTLQNGALLLTNTSAPINQQIWRIRVSDSAPYVGMLVFEALNNDLTVRNTVLALDGVNDLILGQATYS